MRAAVEDQRAARAQRAAAVGQAAVLDVVEDQIVGAAACEVFDRIVDDMVRAEPPHQFGVAPAADGGHLRAEVAGQLHGEMPDPARGTVDQDALAGLQFCDVAQRVQGRQPGGRQRSRLVEFERGGLVHQRIFLRADKAGTGALAGSKHRVTRSEALDLCPDGHDGSRQIEARHSVFG